MSIPLDVGQRLELFVDDDLIGALGGRSTLRLHAPTMRNVVLTGDQPWEGNMCAGYKSCFHDGQRFRLYYQAWHGELIESDGKVALKDAPIRIAMLESDDAIHWRRPTLGLIEFNGSRDNNVTFTGVGPEKKGVHGFAPMLDANPDCPPAARYKALGASDAWPYHLYALQSEDGLRWALMRDEPVMTKGAFDSQNLAFWDVLRGEYRAYIRDFDKEGRRGILTCTSRDFMSWSEPRWLVFDGSGSGAWAAPEQLYTNQVTPYFRAPHIFVGFPARYVERPWSDTIEALPELEHRRLRARASERYGAAVTDGQFMASRDGLRFKRWDEAFIRPGLRPTGSWCYGDCYQGWGLLPTVSDIPAAPEELSMFVSEGYWRGRANIIRRYTLRMDGFVSLHAPMGGGELVTTPIVFSGDELRLNISTSAGGGAKVEVQSVEGGALPGLSLTDCTEIVGDDLAFRVRWRGSLAAAAGRPVRLRFVLHDADLYAFQFAAQAGASPRSA